MATYTAETLSLQQDLLLQADKVLGVTLTCATGLVTIMGALVVYSERLAFMWEARSLVVALGIATGGVLCFTLVELLPQAQSHLEHTMVPLVNGDDGHVTPIVEGYAALALSGAFALGVIMVWAMDMLCMFFALPHKLMRSSRDLTVLTTQRGLSTGSPRSFQSRSPAQPHPHPSTTRGHPLVLHASSDEWVAQELLYRTGTARAIAFAVHNLPEGMALCIAADQKKTLGILFACAIALLNVTRGMTLAGLLTQASGYRWRGVLWCMLAALALPLGGFLAWAVLLQTELAPVVLGVLYAFVSGILISMCLTQVLTVCFNHKTTTTSGNNPVTASVLGGVVFMASIRMMLAFLYT